jgi:hypothetical protein
LRPLEGLCQRGPVHVYEEAPIPLFWMMKQLEAIFAELGITQYLDVFVDQGFDTWETILDITESDLLVGVFSSPMVQMLTASFL